MSETKLCCNCLHCARWRRKDGIETHCDLTDKYLGYLDVMNEDNNCKHWEKETKWDEQKKHDAKVRADAIDECMTILKAHHMFRTCEDDYIPKIERPFYQNLWNRFKQMKEKKE